MTVYSLAVARAAITRLSEKFCVRRAAGRVTPSAPSRNWAAGLLSKRSFTAVDPGTGSRGASGTIAVRRASAVGGLGSL